MKSGKQFIWKLVLLFAALMLILGSYACDEPEEPDPGCGGSDSDYDTYSEGPYQTTQNLRSGPSGDSGVFYPTNIADEPGPFPIFVFGCGAGTNPDSYVDHGNRIASHGFVVVIETSTNSGEELVDAIDWLTQQNSSRLSPFNGKLNLNKVAAGGHSRGSIGTFAIADDPRLTTTVHVAGGSFDGDGPDNLRNPAIYISGEDDLALSNCERDYQNTDNVPVFFTVMEGVDHMAAAREGLPAIIAWLRWHLYDETDRRGDFLDAGGEFTVGMWDSQSKNW